MLEATARPCLRIFAKPPTRIRAEETLAAGGVAVFDHNTTATLVHARDRVSYFFLP
jgi:hypothetical protein